MAATLAQMDEPLAMAQHQYIEGEHKSVAGVSTPFITTVFMENRHYFISFDTFSRPDLKLAVIVFLPHVSITGSAEK